MSGKLIKRLDAFLNRRGAHAGRKVKVAAGLDTDSKPLNHVTPVCDRAG